MLQQCVYLIAVSYACA